MPRFLDASDACRRAATAPDDLATANAAVNALVHVATTPARDAQVDATAPLAGVPIVAKDLIDVAGMPTRCGSRAVQRVATTHAAVIDRLLAAGAAIVGKSHTTEFAMSGWGISPLGRPLNPIDAADRYFTGGSSNGSASAVAAGLVPAALGSDTGGSIRIPSSWCGLTGLKGSLGWVSTRGVAPLSQSFDCVGPMARTAAEVELLYRAMLPAHRGAALDRELGQVRQQALPPLVFLDDASLQAASPEMMAAYRLAQAQCARLGFTVSVEAVAQPFAEMAAIWADLSTIEGYLNHQALVDDPNAAIDAAVRTNFMRGRSFGLADYVQLLDQARECRARVEQQLLPGKLLVVPTTTTPATLLDQFDGQRTLGLYTRFVNLIAGCAIAVPNGLTSDGRPTSMQFVGRYGTDASILHAAHTWQAGSDWHEQIRQLHAGQMRQRREAAR